MKNKEKILLLIIALLAAALAGLIFCNNQPVKVSSVKVQSLPTSEYALVVDDLDADEKDAFCNGNW